MINFSSFGKLEKKAGPTDPLEIWKRRPSGQGTANDLWQGQAPEGIFKRLSDGKM